MDWVGSGVSERGVTERALRVKCEGRLVPGIVWTPEGAAGPRPLVLIGHGGSGHKRQDHLLALARRLVRHHGLAAAAIDGPVHGERRPDGGGDAEAVRREFRATMRRDETTDAMIADWKAVLDALQKLDEIGVSRAGYWGLSMGTMFGLPFVAAEPRVGAAVLGLMGVFPDAPRLAVDAPRVGCPVLFLQQWDDELIPRDACLALFDTLGSRDKRLHANPGRHIEVPPAEFDASEAFLVRHLGV